MKNHSSFVSLLSGYTPAKDHHPFLYEVGQKVRVSKKVAMDGQTPEYWAGALVQILSRRHADILQYRHLYKVKLLHAEKTCEFFEDEFDRRFIRKNLDKRVA